MHQVGEAGVPFGWSMRARMTSQKPRRPQFVRIAEVFRFAAGQWTGRLGLGRDGRLPAGPGTMVEPPPLPLRPPPAQRSAGQSDDAPRALGPPQKTRGLSDKPAIFAPADPACRLCSRLLSTELRHILFCDRQLNRSSPCRHDLQISSRENQKSSLQATKDQIKPSQKIGFMEAMN